MLDETMPIKYKPKHRKRGIMRNKREGPTSKKTKEPHKRANRKGNIKFPIPLQSCFVCEYYYIFVHAKEGFYLFFTRRQSTLIHSI
jgi:hypothetical protein